MKQKLLITCGCSWTYGVGVGYHSSMSHDEYRTIAWKPYICDDRSFRGILSKKYNFKNINLSIGGSSNQQQFRLLKKFLASETALHEEFSEIIVLHGITSTSRNELFLTELNSLVNFKYDQLEYKKWSQFILEHFYNHDNEVTRLAEEMSFLNQFYRCANIKNLWFDTFNHHNYPSRINNLMETSGTPRDLLSTMAILTGLNKIDSNYHESSWAVDSNRVKHLVDEGFLNPISTHPTEQGHKLIAEIIEPHLEKLL